MAYEKAKRKKLLNMIRETIREQIPALGGRVYLSYPPFELPTGDLPAVYIGKGNSQITGGTTNQNNELMALYIIAYVEVDSVNDDLELIKADIQDDIESVLIPLKIDSDFQDIATDIRIDNCDSGADAIAKLGYQAGVFPPYGAIRIDVTIEFYYSFM